jgi:plasmid stabilization system protein ParE
VIPGSKPRLIISRAAKMDTNAAARWYHARSPELGEAFLRAVDDAVSRLLEFPESGPLIYRTLRHLLLDRFPYTLFYVYDPGRVRVIAVMHWRRDPEVWQARAP